MHLGGTGLNLSLPLRTHWTRPCWFSKQKIKCFTEISVSSTMKRSPCLYEHAPIQRIKIPLAISTYVAITPTWLSNEETHSNCLYARTWLYKSSIMSFCVEFYLFFIFYIFLNSLIIPHTIQVNYCRKYT